MRAAHCERNAPNCILVLGSFGNTLRTAFIAIHFVSGRVGSSVSRRMNSASRRNEIFLSCPYQKSRLSRESLLRHGDKQFKPSYACNVP
jgi:hypothetical protein